MSDAGPNMKDPVATAYSGKVPENVSRIKSGGVTTEITPARSGQVDASVTSTEDTVSRLVEEVAADRGEIPQPSELASETLGGATSGDVHRGVGMPVQGQSSAETHHDGRPGRSKREGQGVSQFGPQGEPKSNLRDTIL